MRAIDLQTFSEISPYKKAQCILEIKHWATGCQFRRNKLGRKEESNANIGGRIGLCHQGTAARPIAFASVAQAVAAAALRERASAPSAAIPVEACEAIAPNLAAAEDAVNVAAADAAGLNCSSAD